MGEPHVISALNDKRARLLGEIEVTREKLDVLLQQLAHVEGALALFGHENGKPVKPIRPYPKGYFKHGELLRLTFTLLRERGCSPSPTSETPSCSARVWTRTRRRTSRSAGRF